MAQQRKRYSAQQKEAALKAIAAGTPVAAVSRDFGIHANTLHVWRARSRKAGGQASALKPGPKPAATPGPKPANGRRKPGPKPGFKKAVKAAPANGRRKPGPKPGFKKAAKAAKAVKAVAKNGRRKGARKFGPKKAVKAAAKNGRRKGASRFGPKPGTTGLRVEVQRLQAENNVLKALALAYLSQKG